MKILWWVFHVWLSLQNHKSFGKGFHWLNMQPFQISSQDINTHHVQCIHSEYCFSSAIFLALSSFRFTVCIFTFFFILLYASSSSPLMCFRFFCLLPHYFNPNTSQKCHATKFFPDKQKKNTKTKVLRALVSHCLCC